MLEFIINTVVVPSVALLTPVFILIFHIDRNNLKLSVGWKKLFQFVAVFVLLTLLIFSLLLYLTGDLAYFFYLEQGIYNFDGGVQFNLTNHIGLTFRYDPGIMLLTIAGLSAVLYTSLLVLPQVCTLIPQGLELENTKQSGTGTTVSSGVTATASAVASTAVCCSTSVAAIIAPTISTLLGPFVPYLLYLSIALLIYSYTKIVIPRFPVI